MFSSLPEVAQKTAACATDPQDNITIKAQTVKRKLTTLSQNCVFKGTNEWTGKWGPVGILKLSVGGHFRTQEHTPGICFRAFSCGCFFSAKRTGTPIYNCYWRGILRKIRILGKRTEKTYSPGASKTEPVKVLQLKFRPADSSIESVIRPAH